MHVPIEEIRLLVCRHLRVPDAAPEDRLQADLGAQSPDVAALLAALEDRYEVEIGEEEIADLKTVADLHRRVSS